MRGTFAVCFLFLLQGTFSATIPPAYILARTETAAGYEPNEGIGAYDTACQTEAAASSFSFKDDYDWKAFIVTTTNDPFADLTESIPVNNANGAQIFADASAVNSASSISAPISSLNGDATGGPILTGLSSECLDWSTVSSDESGTLGDSDDTTLWFSLVTPSCAAIASAVTQLYCLGTLSASSSGGQDPHFHGINGEHVDIVIDPEASNKYFSIYCDEKISVSALFSPNPDNLLFMTEFSGHFGDVQFSLKLGKYPQLYGEYSSEIVEAENKTRFVFEEGTIESDGSGMIAKFNNLEVMINTASDVEGNVYFDIDMKPIGPKRREASGIIGRSFERVYSTEEFGEYHHFMLQAEDDKFTACPGDLGRFSNNN